jgi:hypothetical protein
MNAAPPVLIAGCMASSQALLCWSTALACVYRAAVVQEELDPVTLHNLALMHMEEDPTAGELKESTD